MKIKRLRHTTINTEVDSLEFQSIFDAYYPSMCVLANSYLSDIDIAQDIAQDAFVKFWKVRNEYYKIDSIKSYLYIMVKNLSLNYLRKEKIYKKHLYYIQNETFSEFNNKIIQEETYRILDKAIQALPKRSSQIMQLTLKGVQNKEIAERLEISVNTVKTLKTNALKKLRTELKDYIFALAILQQLM